MKYHDHTEILPLLEGAGQSWAYVQDGDRDELRTTLAFGFAEINGASALLQWLVHGHNEGRPLIALLDAAYNQLDDDGRHLQALREQLGGRHAKR